MLDVEFKLIENREIAKNTFEMALRGDTSGVAPGQFVNLKLDGFYLRRPISVCGYTPDTLTLVYKVAGHGTRYMSGLVPGAVIDALTGLGNGYDTSVSGDRPLLIGGGVGVPPLYALAKKLVSEGKRPAVILGFNSADQVFYENRFRALGLDTSVATADGSYGARGLVTDAMGVGYTYFYACGPEPMLKAVYEKSATSGQFSLEERMGCGFGACMGCTCMTRYGPKRVCVDGPVFTKEEMVW